MLDQPPAVLEMLARYERMRREQGFGWGEEDLAEFWGWARFSRLGPAFADFAVSQDWAAAVRTAVGDHPPAGVVRILVAADGSLSARTGRPRPVVRGVTAQIEVIVDSAADDDVAVMVDAQEVAVPPAGAGFVLLDIEADAPPIAVRRGGHVLAVADAVQPVAAAQLALTSADGARWSVVDPTGGAWFPDGVPQKWDAADVPFFHTDPGTTLLTVPALPLLVVAAISSPTPPSVIAGARLSQGAARSFASSIAGLRRWLPTMMASSFCSSRGNPAMSAFASR